MNLKLLKPIRYVVLFSILAFLLHSYCLSHSAYSGEVAEWHNPLIEIYLFFGVCSVFIVFAFLVISIKDIDNAGNSFLLLTILKMIVAYGYFYSMLTSDAPENHEKINFFIVFAVFLTVETIISVRILNDK